MHTPTTCWDRGPTDRELDAFYGTTPDSFEKQITIERFIKSIDKDDLIDVVYENANQVLAAVLDNKPEELMAVFRDSLTAYVARLASQELYGDSALLKASDVTLEAV